jgi:ubiquinone/menaquinone biosynthesis C-methylase UbiE
MGKAGEINYLRTIGEGHAGHAANKPFSDVACHAYLINIGGVMSLLPPPPAAVLDMGCGTGWTSVFLAKRGYDVTGIDIAPDMIFHANVNKQRAQLANLRFLAADYDELSFDGTFDAVVFYDALHHAIDEKQAIRAAYRALKPEGICLTSEPGREHSRQPGSREAMEKYGVTEKDMPVSKVFALGRDAGFRRFRAYPSAWCLVQQLYGNGEGRKLFLLLRAFLNLRQYCRRDDGIALMTK